MKDGLSPPVAVASAPSAAFAASLPLRRDHQPDWASSGIGLGNAFVVVAIVAAFAFWLLRRRAAGARPLAGIGFARAGAGGDALKVVHSTRLTAHASAHVLDWAGGQWLVVCTEGGATVVSRRPQDAGAPPPAGESGR